MAERTEAMLAAQQELLRAVSHELRTPIARLRIGVHLLAGAEGDRAARAEALDGDLQELDDLVDELLVTARLEGGGPRALEAVLLSEVVASVLSQHAPLVGEVALVTGPGLASAPPLQAESRLLIRAVGNLVGNAARHANKRVSVDASVDDRWVRFWVEDDGDGIPEADRERVFQPFVQLDDDSVGYGIGLATVRKIAAWHGGTAAVEDAPGRGCRVVLSLPRAS